MNKVLVVDDSQFMRVCIKNILTKHGYDIIGEAENGEIALKKVKSLTPDIVTLDITLPKMDGIEVLKQIKTEFKDIIVLMVSAMGQAPMVKESCMAGADGFLIKPFCEEDIVKALRNIESQNIA